VNKPLRLGRLHVAEDAENAPPSFGDSSFPRWQILPISIEMTSRTGKWVPAPDSGRRKTKNESRHPHFAQYGDSDGKE
jgi:hypothetical protein